MSPTAGRALVITLSFAILAISAIATAVVWSLLTMLDPLPRGILSLGAWVTVYYLAANLLFWRTVVRFSSDRLSRRP